MKKVYIQPKTILVKTEMQQMVCGSIKETAGGLQMNITEDEGVFASSGINARKSIWGGDEEE